jgi:hypothetical protein
MSEGTQIILFVIVCLAILGGHAWAAAVRGHGNFHASEVGRIEGCTILRIARPKGRQMVGVRLEVTQDREVVACMNPTQARQLAGLLRRAAC